MLGVPRHAITLACVLYALSLLLPVSKILSAATILLGLGITRILAQFGRDLILFVRALFQATVYDAGMRKVYRLK